MRGKGKPKDPKIRLMKYVSLVGSAEHPDCWQWTGCKSSLGYGQFRYQDKMCKAHRVSYELFVGKLADDLVIDHLCNNRTGQISMENNPLDSLPQSEWDAFISSILRPLLMYAKNDPLISYEDLEQEAWVGLLSAAKNYDSTKAKFTTYAYYYVRGRILRYMLEKTRLSPRRTEADPAEVEQGYEDTTLEQGELMGSILSAVAHEPHANFLVEHYINGKSFRKIAKASGMSHQGVAMHVKRLIGLLEKRLNHENA